jgi:hypothetical protein
MARAIELGKFLSSKKEIAIADDVRLFRIKDDILQYMSRGMPKRAYGGFWCAWSKFDRGKKKMTKSAHTIGLSNNISSKTCSYLIYPMHYKMASIPLFFHFKWSRKDGGSPVPLGYLGQ